MSEPAGQQAVPSCVTCKWFQETVAQNKSGICRLNPPTSSQGTWPGVNETDYCSHYSTLTPPASACGSCQYWDATGLQDGLGRCRVNPPISAEAGTSQTATAVWPIVLSTDWCGDFVAA